MEKATHNGTCQVCGRVQAHIYRKNGLAQHGYTVKWGYFNGTCRGSNNRPIEDDTTLAQATINMLEAEIPALRALTVADITRVPVQVKNPAVSSGYKNRYINQRMTREEFEAHIKGDLSRNFWKWESHAASEVRAANVRAAGMEAHIKFLRDLIATRHGKPLLERKVG